MRSINCVFISKTKKTKIFLLLLSQKSKTTTCLIKAKTGQQTKKSPLVNLTHSFTYNLNFPGVVDCKSLLLPKYRSAFPPLESEPTYILVHKQKLDIVPQ